MVTRFFHRWEDVPPSHIGPVCLPSLPEALRGTGEEVPPHMHNRQSRTFWGLPYNVRGMGWIVPHSTPSTGQEEAFRAFLTRLAGDLSPF